jgi:hypothetical protein
MNSRERAIEILRITGISFDDINEGCPTLTLNLLGITN